MPLLLIVQWTCIKSAIDKMAKQYDYVRFLKQIKKVAILFEKKHASKGHIWSAEQKLKSKRIDMTVHYYHC